VLAPKPHQENVEDIADFVWRFCVNYRPLNQVTKPYSYPIARCDAAIDNFGDASGLLHFIFEGKSVPSLWIAWNGLALTFAPPATVQHNFVHRPSRMMKYVDALSQYYDPLIQEYGSMVFRAHQADEEQWPAIYFPSLFPECALRCPDHVYPASSNICESYHNHSQPPLRLGASASSPIWKGVTMFPVRVFSPNRPIFHFPWGVFRSLKQHHGYMHPQALHHRFYLLDG
jgi:hypothetical protein